MKFTPGNHCWCTLCDEEDDTICCNLPEPACIFSGCIDRSVISHVIQTDFRIDRNTIPFIVLNSYNSRRVNGRIVRTFRFKWTGRKFHLTEYIEHPWICYRAFNDNQSVGPASKAFYPTVHVVIVTHNIITKRQDSFYRYPIHPVTGRPVLAEDHVLKTLGYVNLDAFCSIHRPYTREETIEHLLDEPPNAEGVVYLEVLECPASDSEDLIERVSCQNNFFPFVVDRINTVGNLDYVDECRRNCGDGGVVSIPIDGDISTLTGETCDYGYYYYLDKNETFLGSEVSGSFEYEEAYRANHIIITEVDKKACGSILTYFNTDKTPKRLLPNTAFSAGFAACDDPLGKQGVFFDLLGRLEYSVNEVNFLRRGETKINDPDSMNYNPRVSSEHHVYLYYEICCSVNTDIAVQFANEEMAPAGTVEIIQAITAGNNIANPYQGKFYDFIVPYVEERYPYATHWRYHNYVLSAITRRCGRLSGFDFSHLILRDVYPAKYMPCNAAGVLGNGVVQFNCIFEYSSYDRQPGENDNSVWEANYFIDDNFIETLGREIPAILEDNISGMFMNTNFQIRYLIPPPENQVLS